MREGIKDVPNLIFLPKIEIYIICNLVALHPLVLYNCKEK